jgi:26S proteasome regulatory subunit T1
MARSKKACIVFFDEVDAIGGARFDDGVGGDNEVQRTMLEIVNQLDGFDARGNIKVLMATNRLMGYLTDIYIYIYIYNLFLSNTFEVRNIFFKSTH